MITPNLLQSCYLTEIGSEEWIFNQQHLAAASLEERDVILLDRFTSPRNEGAKKEKKSVKQQRGATADICDISFRGKKGARAVKVSRRQTAAGATSAGLQLIDTLTSHISGHLPVMDDTPATTGPFQLLFSPWFCAVCVCAVHYRECRNCSWGS